MKPTESDGISRRLAFPERRPNHSEAFIPGHGPVDGRSDVAEFRDMLVAIRENVAAALKKQGRSLNETIAAKPTTAFDAKWGPFLVTPAHFTGLVYAGV